MLIALLNGLRVAAAACTGSADFVCPGCETRLILKRGTRRIAHFAHKPESTCAYAAESTAHMCAKIDICNEYKNRGHHAEIEVPVLSSLEDRRADVLIVSPTKDSLRYAVEVQDSNVGETELWRRTRAYRVEGVCPVWICLLRRNFWNVTRDGEDRAVVAKYPPRLHERWIETVAGEVWYYDADAKAFWQARFKPHMLWHDGADFIDVSAVEHVQVDGFQYVSRRWVDALVTGPWPLSRIQISANSKRKIGTFRVRQSDG